MLSQCWPDAVTFLAWCCDSSGLVTRFWPISTVAVQEICCPHTCQCHGHSPAWPPPALLHPFSSFPHPWPRSPLCEEFLGWLIAARPSEEGWEEWRKPFHISLDVFSVSNYFNSVFQAKQIWPRQNETGKQEGWEGMPEMLSFLHSPSEMLQGKEFI